LDHVDLLDHVHGHVNFHLIGANRLLVKMFTSQILQSADQA